MKISDLAPASAAQIIDLNSFRKTKRVDLATVRRAAVDPRSIALPSGAVVSIGDKILDAATREHGRVDAIRGEGRLAAIMIAFPWGRRAVLASALDMWSDDLGELSPGQLGLALGSCGSDETVRS